MRGLLAGSHIIPPSRARRYSRAKKPHRRRAVHAPNKPSVRQSLVEFKKFFNAIPLRQLLIFVYQKYPKFTTESKIRGKLGL